MPTMKQKSVCRNIVIVFACLILVHVALWLAVTATGNRRLYPPPVNLSNLSFIINNNVCRDNGSGVPIVAVMMVTSHIGNVKKRTIMREAYPADLLKNLGVRRAFVLATLDQDIEEDPVYKSISEEEILKESQLYQDIVQVNFTEAHRKLTYKNLMGLKYAVTYCGNASFVVKLDDDILFDVYQLLELLKSVKKRDRDKLLGHVWGDADPDRNQSSKYYVPVEEYPAKTYPAYVSGFLFITSLETTRLLVATSELVSFLSIDDVLITGIITQKAGVRLVDFGRKVTLAGTLKCCRTDDVVYKCVHVAGLRASNDDVILKKISDHAGLCHTENNCQILPATYPAHLKCF